MRTARTWLTLALGLSLFTGHAAAQQDGVWSAGQTVVSVRHATAMRHVGARFVRVHAARPVAQDASLVRELRHRMAQRPRVHHRR